MAGIGFEMRRAIAAGPGFLGKVRVYVSAGLIAAGPWLVTVATLCTLGILSPYVTGAADFTLFRVLVTYSAVFSLLVVGTIQLPVTRQLADLLYDRSHANVLPAFGATLLGVGVFQVIVGTTYCVFADLPRDVAFAAVTLYVVNSFGWLTLIWLGVVRDYDTIMRAFVTGGLATLLLLLMPGVGESLFGLLAVYALGQSLTLVLLVRPIVRGVEPGDEREFGFWRKIGSLPRLVLVGILFNAAAWSDKLLFWIVDGVSYGPLFRYHPLYDSCSFLAYATIVPSLAINLVQLETDFYQHYRGYYQGMLDGENLTQLAVGRERILRSLREGAIKLLRVQSYITVTSIILAPGLMELLQMPPAATQTFRLMCIGSFFHVLLMLTLLVQLYFDLRSDALISCFVFLVLNAVLAKWSLDAGPWTYGAGYAGAALGALLVAFGLLQRSLKKLEYLTFANQLNL